MDRKSRAGEAHEVPQESADPMACKAYGCPLPGSISTGGPFMCSAHAWVQFDRWDAITQQLRAHAWLLDLMAVLRREDMQPTKWWVYADAFWRNAEPDMCPQPGEVLSLYRYRMHLTLMHRVGARLQRPDALQPHSKQWAAQRAAEVLDEAVGKLIPAAATPPAMRVGMAA